MKRFILIMLSFSLLFLAGCDGGGIDGWREANGHEMGVFAKDKPTSEPSSEDFDYVQKVEVNIKEMLHIISDLENMINNSDCSGQDIITKCEEGIEIADKKLTKPSNKFKEVHISYTYGMESFKNGMTSICKAIVNESLTEFEGVKDKFYTGGYFLGKALLESKTAIGEELTEHDKEKYIMELEGD